MTTIHDALANELIAKTAEQLKAKDTLKMPEWAAFVKTGTSRERAPDQEDWWYFRAASILRAVYLRGPLGVNKLRLKYGSKKNRGHKTERFFKSSGKIIRVVLQQLEASGLIQKKAVGVHKGRMVTNAGKSFLDKIATEIAGVKPKPQKPKEAPKQEKPKAEALREEKPKEAPKQEKPKADKKVEKEVKEVPKQDVKHKEPKQKAKAGKEE